jgi:nucleotide-binding universal stress UspA family protein
MTTIHRILVPVDLTETSEDTLRYGFAWAELFGSELHVLHVVPDVQHALGVDLAGVTMKDEWMRDATRALETLVASVAVASDQVRRAVCVGQPAQEIERYAAAQHIDLIVMAAHRHNVLARVALGSVAEQVVRKAPCPVVTVPPEVKPPKWLGGVRTVLLPTDLGDSSRAMFHYASEVATCLGAALRVIHVAVPPWGRELAYLPPSTVTTQMEQLTGRAPEHAKPAVEPGIDVQSTIRVGEPSEKVLSYADEVRADLIVMATHGRNAFARILLGSVTQAVLRASHCPVLTLSPSACRWLRELSLVGAEELTPERVERAAISPA